MAVIYKLTREDGLEYIGITINLPKRLSRHRKSRRFEELKIKDVIILFEGTYDECDECEELFIRKYDTFKNGLNLTDKGKGKNDTTKFNTFGFTFSEESKKKMSESAKNRIDRPKGYTHTDSTKLNWSIKRKGKIWGPVLVDKDTIIQDWYNFKPELSEMDHLISDRSKDSDILYFKNGRPFSYNKGKLVLFKKIKSDEYNVTPEAIKRIITNESLL